MPFQPINFATIEPQGNPAMRDFADSLAEGYKLGKVPEQMKQESQKADLLNAWQQLRNQEQPERFKSEMTRDKLLNSLTGAQINNEQMKSDPAKRVAYIQALVAGLNKAGMGNSGNSSSLTNALVRKSLGLPAAAQPDAATTGTRTSNQGIIRSIDNALPILAKIQKFDEPGQALGKYFSPSDQATYESLTGTITDSLLGAFGLPKTNESIDLMNKVVARRPMETHENYQTRLTSLVKELQARRSTSTDILKGISQTDDGSQSSSDSSRTFNLSNGAWE